VSERAVPFSPGAACGIPSIIFARAVWQPAIHQRRKPLPRNRLRRQCAANRRNRTSESAIVGISKSARYPLRGKNCTDGEFGARWGGGLTRDKEASILSIVSILSISWIEPSIVGGMDRMDRMDRILFLSAHVVQFATDSRVVSLNEENRWARILRFASAGAASSYEHVGSGMQAFVTVWNEICMP